jgi:hypothetical protein
MGSRSGILIGALAPAFLSCSSGSGSGSGASKDAGASADATPVRDGASQERDASAHDAKSEAVPIEAGRPTNAVASDAFVDTIGLNVHLSYDGTCYDTGFDTLVTMMASLGVRHIRDGLIDFPSPATYYDRLNQLGKAGVHATLITSPTQTASLLLDYPSRVPDAIEAYESPNEPDLNEGADWVATTQAFQKTLYETIKGSAATRNYPVLGPSITSEMGDALVGDLSGYLDYGNMHNYFAGFNPGTPGWGGTDTFGTYGSISWSKNIMAQVSGTKPILTTETGWGDGTGANEIPPAIKARYVTRLFLEQYRQGVVRTIEYQFCDNTGDATDYGIVAGDMTPKPAFTALQSLMNRLTDPGPAFPGSYLDYAMSSLAPEDVHSLLFQKRTGTFELVLWLEEQSYDPNAMPPAPIAVPPVTVDLEVKTPLSSATFGTIDDTGNLTSTPLPIPSGRASIAVTDHVSFVELVPEK